MGELLMVDEELYAEAVAEKRAHEEWIERFDAEYAVAPWGRRFFLMDRGRAKIVRMWAQSSVEDHAKQLLRLRS